MRALRPRRWSPLVPAVAVAAVVVAGCGVPTDGPVATVARDDLPAALQSTTTTTTTTRPSEGGAPVTVALHWVAGERLVREEVAFGSPPGPGRVLALLAAGPGPEDGGGSLRSALPGGAVRQVALDDRVAVVVTGPSFTTRTGPDQVLALGQLVASLTSLPEVDGVEVRVDGEPVEVPVADGTLVRRVLRLDDYASLLAGTSR